MSRALGAIASRVVGRRVRLRPRPGGIVGTVTRVDGRGMTVRITGLTAADLEWLED